MLNNKRIVLYSHDGRSYGHISKLGKFSEALIKEKDDLSVYCISSSPFGSNFIKPFNRIDYLKLPSYYTIYNHETNNFDTKFFVKFKKEEFYDVRKALLTALFEYYKPYTLFMECNPLGKRNEMYSIIKNHKKQGGKVVWGINGIVDPADFEFGKKDVMDFLAQRIDKIFVYNQKEIVDVINEYPELEKFSDRIKYIGYLCPPLVEYNQDISQVKKVLIQTGGGGRSILLMRKIIKACCFLSNDICNIEFKIYTGQYLPDSEFNEHKSAIANCNNINLCKFTNNILEELSNCYLFIGAGGYNTLSELIRYPKRSIIIPVQVDESEQKKHCERLLDLGVINKFLPFNSDIATIIKTIAEGLNYNEPIHKINFKKDGISRFVEELINTTKE